MSEEKKQERTERFINSLALAVSVTPECTKHVQIVITATEDNLLHCYFDVVDPNKIPKLAEE